MGRITAPAARRRRLLAALALGGLVGLWLWPAPVAAHSRLLRSTPAAGQVLTAAPGDLRLWFSEPVALDFSTVQVLDRGRHRQDSGAPDQPDGDQSSLHVTLAPTLPSGTYTVLWHVVSATDGHLTEGNFAFIVRRPGEPTPTPGAEPTPLPGSAEAAAALPPPPAPVSPLRWTLRALALLVAAWLLGGPLFIVLILDPAVSDAQFASLRRAAQRRWSRLSVGGAVLLLALLGTDMLFQVADLTGGSLLTALGQGDVLGRFLGSTSYGLYWVLRVGAVVVVGLLCLGLTRRPTTDTTLWSISVAAAGLIFAGEALSSHLAAVPAIGGLPVGTLSDLVHLLAAGAWIGGLLYIAVVLLPLLHVPGVSARARWQLLGQIIPRFSNLALISVGLLIVTGFVNLALHTLDPAAIVASSYGQVLIVKHLLFLPLLALGAVQNRRILPRLVALLSKESANGVPTVRRFGQLIRIEGLLASAVLLCAAGLTLLPPPVSGSAAGPGATIPPPSPTAVLSPTPSPTPVVVTGTQTLGGLQVSLVVVPDPLGDHFTVRLGRAAAGPLVPADLRTQFKVTPQDINAGSTLVPLTLAASAGATLIYTATDPLLTLAGGYDARVLVAQRQGSDVNVAFRLDLDEQGGLTIRPAPFIQVQVSTAPSPAISGTVGIDLRLSDGVGAPVSGATVEIIPIMPAHAHIQPLAEATPVVGQPGIYHTTSRLTMGGGWLLIITVNQPGQLPVKTDASFDVIDPDATPTPPP